MGDGGPERSVGRAGGIDVNPLRVVGGGREGVDARLVVNYGLDKLRFPAPVPSGSRVRLRATLQRVEPKGEGRLLLGLRCEVEREGSDTPVLVADALHLLVRD